MSARAELVDLARMCPAVPVVAAREASRIRTTRPACGTADQAHASLLLGVVFGSDFRVPGDRSAIARRMTAHGAIWFVNKRAREPIAFDVVRPV